uniref:G-protein coupled receptors family 1 profile domain-containing protein n=1 Tax=Plectus sambesii TaxID=2011161 RepID=A0A914VAU9_9BILA
MNAVPADIQAMINLNIQYIVVGASIMIENIIVMLVFLSSSSLRRKYHLLIALAIADALAGCSTLTAGYGRHLIYTKWPDLPNSTTVMDCVRTGWPPLLAIGGLWPATLVLVIGIERALAVFTPMFYHARYTTKHRWFLIIASLLIVLIGLLCAYLDATLRNGSKPAKFACTMDDTFPPLFNHYHRTAIMCLHIAGLCLSVTAFQSARKQSRLAGSRGTEMRGEMKRIVAIVAISGFSTVLVSCPMFILTGFQLGIFSLPAGLSSFFFFIVFSLNSFLGLFIYLFLKKDFRSHFVQLITFKSL